jgi:hypothetical protein
MCCCQVGEGQASHRQWVHPVKCHEGHACVGTHCSKVGAHWAHGHHVRLGDLLGAWGGERGGGAGGREQVRATGQAGAPGNTWVGRGKPQLMARVAATKCMFRNQVRARRLQPVCARQAPASAPAAHKGPTSPCQCCCLPPSPLHPHALPSLSAIPTSFAPFAYPVCIPCLHTLSAYPVCIPCLHTSSATPVSTPPPGLTWWHQSCQVGTGP